MSPPDIVSLGQEQRVETAECAETTRKAFEDRYSVLKYREVPFALRHRQQDHVRELFQCGSQGFKAVTFDGNITLHLALQLRNLIILGKIDTDQAHEDERIVRGIIHELIASDQIDACLRNHAHETPLDILNAFGNNELLFVILEKNAATNKELEMMHAIPEMYDKLEYALEASKRLDQPLPPKRLRMLFSHGADLFREITNNMSLREFATSTGASEEVLEAINDEEEKIVRILKQNRGCASSG